MQTIELIGLHTFDSCTSEIRDNKIITSFGRGNTICEAYFTSVNLQVNTKRLKTQKVPNNYAKDPTRIRKQA